MTQDEKNLLSIIERLYDTNLKAIALQSYIAQYGPLSEEAGIRVREILSSKEKPK